MNGSAVLPKAKVNLNGQAIGRKGGLTRRRLIDATVALLETNRLRDLRVAEIARDAGTSPATFYVYFPDVSDAVLAALEENTQSIPALMSLVNADWSNGDAVTRAGEIVRGYLDYWADHNALFRVRNLAADEGDVRFMNARADATRELMFSIRDALERSREAGWISADLDPDSTSGVIVAMMERVAAVQFYYDRDSLDRDEMIHSTAYIIARLFAPTASK
jgi:AcrR family transcriptional regulator